MIYKPIHIGLQTYLYRSINLFISDLEATRIKAYGVLKNIKNIKNN